jgi:hypothetical protein
MFLYKFCSQISKKQTMFFKIAGSPHDGSKKALPTAKLKMCIIKQIRYFDQLERLSLSNRALRQYRIILSADTASEARQMPSQKRR